MMVRKVVQLSFLFLGATLGVLLIPGITEILQISNRFLTDNSIFHAALGAILFYLIFFWLVDYTVDIVRYIEEKLIKTPVTDILFGSIGLILGLIVAFLISLPLRAITFSALGNLLPIFSTLLLGYLGFQVGFKKRDELLHLFTFSKAGAKKKSDEATSQTEKLPVKVLDTSVIIDGRIADICETGFLEGVILVPRFVLEELQYIADSSDTLKRNRGRRGLDILNRMQKEVRVKVEICETNFPEIQEVDSKLVQLAKQMKGTLVTNDYNLNKVCELQGVSVLNINDLANAVKPVVIPGEVMRVQIIKDGKEQNQGVAYLDDGTMIVVEEGKGMIGRIVDVEITSVLQTSAGRMIFAKIKKNIN